MRRSGLTATIRPFFATGVGDVVAVNGADDSIAMSNGSAMVGAASQLSIVGDSNSIVVNGNDNVTGSGANLQFDVRGAGNTILLSNATVTIEAGATATTSA